MPRTDPNIPVIELILRKEANVRQPAGPFLYCDLTTVEA